MATAQTMLRTPATPARALPHAALLVAAALFAGGCAGREAELVPPEQIVAPYPAAARDILWAVAPFRNESGTSAADALKVSDAFVASITSARGLAALPMNRTLAAMRALGMPAVASPQDARILADALGADGILVGTITAYDPYDPPKLGITLGLYARPGMPGSSQTPLDPRALAASPRDDTPLLASSDEPLSLVSEYLDARSHETLMEVRRYAEGRHDQETSLSWRRYTASMDLYVEFAAHRCLSRILQEERLRLAGASAPPPAK